MTEPRRPCCVSRQGAPHVDPCRFDELAGANMPYTEDPQTHERHHETVDTLGRCTACGGRDHKRAAHESLAAAVAQCLTEIRRTEWGAAEMWVDVARRLCRIESSPAHVQTALELIKTGLALARGHLQGGYQRPDVGVVGLRAAAGERVEDLDRYLLSG